MTIRDIAVAFGFEVDDRSVSNAERTIQGLKSMAMKALGAIGIGFSISSISKFANECTQIASDVSEMESKFEVVFGNMSDEVDQWANDYADSVGRSRSAIKTYLADQQNLLVGFTDGSEQARAEASKLAEDMTSLALDIASFANTDEDVAVERMTKAVMGESEAAKGLGAVLNDITREEAMHRMGLQGSYNSLDQYTKMLVNLNAIQYQSKDAIGDCVNSLDRYESKTRQLAAKQKDLKELIGKKLIPIMSILTSWKMKLVEFGEKVAKAVLGETEEENKLLKVTERIQNLIKRVQPVIARITTGIGRLIDKLGGMKNILKILTLTIGAFASVMVFTKGIAAFKKLTTAIKTFDRATMMARLKVLAIVAVIVLIALVIEDFYNFMKGNDSVIGKIMEKAGIDTEEARKKISEAFKKIKEVVGNVFRAIGDFFVEHKDQILSVIATIGKIVGVIIGAIAVIKTVIAVVKAVKAVIAAVSAVIAFVTSPIGLVVAAIAALIAIGVLLYKNWDTIKAKAAQLGSYIVGIFTNIKNAIVSKINEFAQAFPTAFGVISGYINGWKTSIMNIIDGVKQIFQGIIDFFTGVFTGNWEKAFSGLKNIVTGIFETIRGAISAPFNAAIGAVNGIIDAVNGALGKITIPDWVPIWGGKTFSLEIPHLAMLAEGGIATKATEAVIGEGSEPEAVLPLSKLGAMISGYIKMAKESEALNAMKSFLRASTANPSTAMRGSSGGNYNVVQNNEFNNSYYGTDRESAKTVSKGMKKSATDATTEMARALAYGRG